MRVGVSRGGNFTTTRTHRTCNDSVFAYVVRWFRGSLGNLETKVKRNNKKTIF